MEEEGKRKEWTSIVHIKEKLKKRIEEIQMHGIQIKWKWNIMGWDNREILEEDNKNSKEGTNQENLSE